MERGAPAGPGTARQELWGTGKSGGCWLLLHVLRRQTPPITGPRKVPKWAAVLRKQAMVGIAGGEGLAASLPRWYIQQAEGQQEARSPAAGLGCREQAPMGSPCLDGDLIFSQLLQRKETAGSWKPE